MAMRLTRAFVIAMIMCGVSAGQDVVPEGGKLPPNLRLVKPLMPRIETPPVTVPPGSSAEVTPVQRPARCGHIIVYRAPNIDSKSVIKVPESTPGSMRVYPGLPPCPENIR